MLSLRGRVVAGAILWSLGLSLAGVLVTGAILLRNPSWARHTHLTANANAQVVIVLAIVCLYLGVRQVRKGFAPLTTLRARLADVTAGRETRLAGRYPAEVQPLVDELNALLADRERRVSRALARAGDLAHGLKTPLAVLAQEADRPEADSVASMAGLVGLQVDRMQRQIDRHMAHARAAASGATPGARCDVLAAAEGLVRTLRRLHADRGVALDLRVPSDLVVRAQREDLEEMLGNVLDNAFKWAKARVDLAASAADRRVRITIDDDGAGVAPAMWDAVLQRGVRADEAAPGTGLGLAITREMAEVYGGNVMLSQSPLGGLRVTLDLPAVVRFADFGTVSGERG